MHSLDKHLDNKFAAYNEVRKSPQHTTELRAEIILEESIQLAQAKHGGTIQKAWRALAGWPSLGASANQNKLANLCLCHCHGRVLPEQDTASTRWRFRTGHHAQHLTQLDKNRIPVGSLRSSFKQASMACQWQRGLLQMSVNSDDAGELFAQLRSVPLQDKPSGQSLTRSALFAAMQKPDAISRLIQLLTKLQHKNQKGVSASASSSFEGRSYGTAQLSQADFERQMAKLSLGTIQEAKLIYSYLDVNQDGQVHMDDLLNALTAFEGGYLPYREVKPAAFFPKDPEPESSDAAEESSGSRQTPSSKLKALIKSRLSPTLRLLRSTMTSPVDLRSASRAETIAEELAEDRPGLTDSALSMRPPSSLLSVAISPTDIKSCHAGGSSASGRSTALAAASTALPDDSDSDEERRQEAREVRRPWTSQEASSRTSPASMTKRPMGGVKQIQLQKRLRSAAGTTRPASSLGAVSSPTGIGRGSPSPVAASSPVVGSALPKAPMMQLGPTVNLAAALDGLPQQEVNRGLPGSSKPLQTPRLEAGSRKANTSPQGKLPALAGGLAGRPKASPR
ncbi:unnamed protein product [Polarella glacialis]|uniref:EF-hand domain-containing protein n=1 Tax=Polarella glacialis TaxID=89957 RepID=A0A813DIA3_POLGL|nr:unnamed protein product [Polarella glacialis]